LLYRREERIHVDVEDRPHGWAGRSVPQRSFGGPHAIVAGRACTRWLKPLASETLGH